jgi:UDP-glucose:(heptosyl)LPS alpha-1,3-glucosyltransferase
MKIAFILFKYFPFGGLQRDFMRIALQCAESGNEIDVYTLSWQGEQPEVFNIHIVPVRALTNHRRYQLFQQWVQDDLNRHPVDVVVGFNKLPDLDLYYAADACYEEKAQTLRSRFYRMGGRYNYFSANEKAVFSRASKTDILMISEIQKPIFIKYYHTPDERFHLLPPGIAKDRKEPVNAAEIRTTFRQEFQLKENDRLMLMIGSGFKTKGLDRALLAMQSLADNILQNTRFIVIGQDNPKRFQRYAQKLGLSERVRILSGRDDIPRFLLGADVLIHPAYNENTGTVLLEALVSGLPVLVTDVCGYAHYIEAAQAGVLIHSPFEQQSLNTALLKMLTDKKAQQLWHQNGLNFAASADIYSMPERAAELIQQTALKKNKRQ